MTTAAWPVASRIAGGERACIVVHGGEDRRGRALLVVSALHHCGRWLAEHGVRVRFVATTRPVRVALSLLAFHTGLEVEVFDANPVEAPDRVFDAAILYVGVVFERVRALELDEARRRGIDTLVAVQFPLPERLDASLIENLRCAFDPVALSHRLRAEVLRLGLATEEGAP